MGVLYDTMPKFYPWFSKDSSYIFNISTFLYYFWSLIFFVADTYLEEKTVKKYKHQSGKKVPGLPFKVVINVMFNTLVTSPVCIYFFVEAPGSYFGIERTWETPGILEFAKYTAVTLFIEDLLSFVFHYCAHQPPFYAHIHKIHHSYHNPVGFSAVFCHPLEQIFVNSLPAMVPMAFITNNWFILAWFCQVMSHTVFVHSGYVWFLRDHDLHHELQTSNFGFGPGFFDWVFGTRYIAGEKKTRRGKMSKLKRMSLTVRRASLRF